MICISSNFNFHSCHVMVRIRSKQQHFAKTGARLFLANYILENIKIVIRQKRSKTNHKNQQLLVMGLLQYQKLVNAFFLKIILLSSRQKDTITIMPTIQQKQQKFLESRLDLLYRRKIQKQFQGYKGDVDIYFRYFNSITAEKDSQ